MSSKKCTECGLVNFAKFDTCQRCQSLLGETTTTQHRQRRSVDSNHGGICLNCGNEGKMAMHPVEVESSSFAFELGQLFLGREIELLQDELTNKLTISMPCCSNCVAGLNRAVWLKPLAPYGSAAFIGLGIFSIIIGDTYFSPISTFAMLFLISMGFVLAIAFFIFVAIYCKEPTMKIKCDESNKLVLELFDGTELRASN